MIRDGTWIDESQFEGLTTASEVLSILTKEEAIELVALATKGTNRHSLRARLEALATKRANSHSLREKLEALVCGQPDGAEVKVSPILFWKMVMEFEGTRVESRNGRDSFSVNLPSGMVFIASDPDA